MSRTTDRGFESPPLFKIIQPSTTGKKSKNANLCLYHALTCQNFKREEFCFDFIPAPCDSLLPFPKVFKESVSSGRDLRNSGVIRPGLDIFRESHLDNDSSCLLSLTRVDEQFPSHQPSKAQH
ncbi:hypothetical protein NPIL_139561 [Nephila pilipes]|uniref:Uncharacterized protein n=1 Tax=Nephila pilipes TaxID=299642 RepID=A0A8X6IY36_NEPPI|nr:hypothetical protein NPIL_139561 [Nephila pilipes]